MFELASDFLCNLNYPIAFFCLLFCLLCQNTRVSSAHPAILGELKVAFGKHGLGDHTLDFLEQVRVVVKRIGNALGLLRILAAGCIHYFNGISRCVL